MGETEFPSRAEEAAPNSKEEELSRIRAGCEVRASGGITVASRRTFPRQVPVAVFFLCLPWQAFAAHFPSLVIPLEVRDGRCEAVVPTGHPGDKYYLVVGSLVR